MPLTLLSQDPLWSDITPIAQQEAEGALVPIMYGLEYQDAMDYFRAVSASEEHSERALDLTLRIIRMNPAHYTVWQYRFQTLLKLEKSLTDELGLMNELAEENMKSYQVWHHRLLLLTHLPPPISPSTIISELSFIATSLLPDAKNYHTWAYRQFVLTHFEALLTPEDWRKEQTWLDSLLKVEGDVRNNSAWGHRWFLSFGRVGVLEGGKGNVEREVEYTLSQIKLVPNNASSWAYLRG
ncbi:hypothetical protein BDY24DRAFT_337162 [Mrakia frigida]|uniref:bifunctional protein farnesyltransferase/protein geranylgeranyltransferase n=1 Tax=Mrakia frigida TaxID=29902 RepID=UPI003FCBF2B6